MRGGQWLDTTLLATTNAELPGVMKSNRKFDVLLDGTILSLTTNRNAFVLTPPLRICRVRALKKKKCQLPVAICDVRDANVLVA